MEVIERLHCWTPIESQVRFRMAFDASFGYESGSPLSIIYELWKQAPSNRAGVRYASFSRVIPSLPEDLRTSITIMETGTGNPKGYLVSKHPMRSGFDYVENRIIGEMPSAMNRRTLVDEYAEIKRDKDLRYYEIHQFRAATNKTPPKSRHYTKLMCPLCDIESRIVRVLSVVRRSPEPVVPLTCDLKAPVFVR